MASSASCAACNNVFTDPRLLPCLHVFCRGCLESVYSPNEGTLTCPTCYSVNTCPAPDQLPRHIRLERESTLLSVKLNQETLCGSCEGSNKVQAYCKDCDGPICSDCVEIHKRIKATKSHSVVSLDQSQTTVQHVACIFHPNEAVKYYCSSCSCLMCSECLFGHKDHECCRVDSDELLQREKQELQSILPQVETAVSPLAEAIGNINDMIERVKANGERVNGDINEAFRRISEAVERRRLELIQEVKNSTVARSTQLELQKEGLERISRGLEVSLSAGRVAVNDYNSLELLGVKGSVYSASKRCLRELSLADLQPVCNSDIMATCDTAEVIDLVSGFGSFSLYSSHPPLCSLVGINPKLPIGVAKDSESVLTLQSRNDKGEDLVTGTEACVEGSLVDTSSGEEITKCVVKGLDNGKYEISFNPTTLGQYKLHITVDGDGIGNSPFTINVRDYTTLTGPTNTTSVDSYPAFIDIGPNNLQYITHDDGFVTVYNSKGERVTQSKVPGSYIRGIAVDEENGVMFVASAGTHQIIKATWDGKVISSVGRKGTGELEFNFPMGVFLTRDGYLLVAGNSNNRIQVLGTDLSFIRSIPCSPHVYGVSVDNTGNIHAAVSSGVEVYNITTGEKITQYGQGVVSQAGDVAFLSSLSSSKCCYSFVTVSNGKVVIFDWLNNTVVCSLKTGVSNPFGIAIDQEGTIVVCCFNGKTIVKY